MRAALPRRPHRSLLHAAAILRRAVHRVDHVEAIRRDRARAAVGFGTAALLLRRACIDDAFGCHGAYRVAGMRDDFLRPDPRRGGRPRPPPPGGPPPRPPGGRRRPPPP